MDFSLDPRSQIHKNLHTIIVFDDELRVRKVINAFRQRHLEDELKANGDKIKEGTATALKTEKAKESELRNRKKGKGKQKREEDNEEEEEPLHDNDMEENEDLDEDLPISYDVDIEVVNEPGNIVVTSSKNEHLEEIIAWYELNHKNVRIERFVVVPEFQNGWPVLIKLFFYFVVMGMLGWLFMEMNSSKYASQMAWWFPYITWLSWTFGVLVGMGRIFAYFYMTPPEKRPDVNLY
eukprot:Nk52_evm47s1444 gene=Nk52_evmTU47s1444